MTSLATKLRVLQAERGVLNKEVAAYIGKSVQAYSNYKSTVRPQMPDGKTLKLLARFFGVTVDYLLEDEGEPDSPSQEHQKQADNGTLQTRPMPRGLKEVAENAEIRKTFSITDEDIKVASTAFFYGGQADKLSVKDWIEIIQIVQRLGKKE